MQRLDQTGDAAGFNGVANVGLHTAELKPRKLGRIAAIAQIHSTLVGLVEMP